jgi:type IV secretion system protein VirD4
MNDTDAAALLLARGAAGEGLVGESGESHLLVIAPTGAGKGRSVLLPWLLSYPGGVIVVDPKGEAAAVSARWRAELGHQVCIVDPWREGSATLNPLEAALRGSADLGDDCLTLAELVAGEAPLSLQDPFWRACALQLLTALLGWVWLRPELTGRRQPDDGTPGAVWSLLHTPDLPLALARLLDQHGAALPAFVREGFVGFLQHEGERVRTSVRSEAATLMRVFGSPRVQRATAGTTLPLATLAAGGAVSLYLVVPPDRLESHAAYLRIQLGALLALLVRRTRRPRWPTLLVVDELGHLGPVPALKQAITLLRGYGVRVALFVQSVAQLRSVWPRDHETVLANCGTWLTFGHGSLTAARQVADQLGDIGAETLFALPPGHLALHRAGRPTELALKLDYLHDPLFAGRFDANPLHAAPPLPLRGVARRRTGAAAELSGPVS